ncbi:MAG: adenylate/guanylate cyclase domain-containing protein [Alphaproteobacteria bacterium]
MPEAPLPVAARPPDPPQPMRRRISVVWALVANFGGLLVVAMLAIFGFAFWSASGNTIELLRDRAEATINQLQTRLREHLDQPAEELKLMAGEIASGRIAPERTAEFDAFLLGGLAGMPQLRVLSYMKPDLSARGAQRLPDGIAIGQADLSSFPNVAMLARQAWARRASGWTQPLYNPVIRETVIVAGQPVIRDGQVIGVLVAVVSTEELSRYVERIGREANASIFILYGRDHVLAHAMMRGGRVSASAEEPLPTLARFGDPVLAALWNENHNRGRLFVARPPIENRTIDVNGEYFPFFYTELTGYSDKPLLVGAYTRSSDFSEIINRLVLALVAGGAAIVGAILMAILIGRRLARPVQRISEAAALVGDLRVSEVRPLPRSRIRELDEQARAFNSMTGALRWFETYVPKPLARHLLKSGDTREVESELRNLTVMFTDIAGFSTASQQQDAAAVAAYLNRHFGIVNDCIEAEGGIVDKYIGDSVMAFWGAPEKIKNRAERACRAALAIRAAIERDNALCRAEGRKETRMRIGIHSGDATVGNIGSSSRINYTIIGDMVNVGQRIEQIGKVLAKAETVAILLSESTRADLGPDFAPRSLGRHKLKGRVGDMEIFAL